MTMDSDDMVDPDRAERIYYAIVAGTGKDACELDLTEAESVFWDVIVQQVHEGNQRGAVWASPASLDSDEPLSTTTQVQAPNPDVQPRTSYDFNRDLQPGQGTVETMDEDFKTDELIAVTSERELRFSHYEDVRGERMAFGYVTNITETPPKRFEPNPLLSIFVRGYWRNSEVTP